MLGSKTLRGLLLLLKTERRSPIPTVKAVTEQIGFSDRHFNQLFRDQVGLTPKRYCRMRRLQRVLHRLAGKKQVDRVEVAFTCGYFDQAHFIHDFRAICSLHTNRVFNES